ncbi:MAG: HDOD domain-containing protein [Nitrospirae bacterium]|nr:HDOD domain-containing protein [Nitrospirota bacterium]
MTYNRQEIIGMVEQMPAFPRSVYRVMELASDINCDPKELVEVIEHDPVLILKILKVVNSPYFSLGQKITSVNHAVVYIGLNTVKNLAMSTATIGALPRKNKAGFDMDAFLLHSLATATIARLFARELGVPVKESFDYFVSGLLHDFGKAVLAHFTPDEFQMALTIAKERQVPLYMAENEIFDIDHSLIGSLLGERWRLPANLVASLKGHHCLEGDRLPLTSVVAAANQVSKWLQIGDSGNPILEKMPDAIAEQFGEDFGTIVERLGGVTDEIEKAKVFIQG